MVVQLKDFFILFADIQILFKISVIPIILNFHVSGSTEFVSKQPSQLIVQLNSSLRHIIVTQHITRAEYFKSFYNLLSIQEGITELRAIEKAFVPVIKFRFNGIEIDMTFTRLNK